MPNIIPYKPDRSPRTNNGRGVDGTDKGKEIVKRRHEDWIEHNITWRRLLDSYEAGERYRNQTYGPDRRGMPTHNLFRHKREYPDPRTSTATYPGFAGSLDSLPESYRANFVTPGSPGSDASSISQDDDYELRRARTPVPEFVAETIEIHLSKIFDQEVHREGPADLTKWWTDVDGRGTAVDDWMRETIAPLLLVLGCLDLSLDHPEPEPGAVIVTRADVLAQGLDRCVASYILPQNMVWWYTDRMGRYVECLVQEFEDAAWRDAGKSEQDWNREYVRYRHWTGTESVLYNSDGSEVVDRVPHTFGRVPIIRLVDVPKHRCPHLGKSRYEGIAEIQREYYNRDSELILSDTVQAHPFLSGPDDYCGADKTVSIGPGYVLPMKKNAETGGYQGWEFVSPPKDPADSLRQNKTDLINMKDRRASLTKPAGASGTQGTTVAQSGISKQIDAETGHKLLAGIARSLARTEKAIAEMVCLVLRGVPVTPAERDAIRVVYPAKFELFSAAELTDNLLKLQVGFSQAGEAPNVEREILQSIVRQTLLGMTDEEYKVLDDEIALLVEAKATLKEQAREMYTLAGGIGADTSGSGDNAAPASGTAPGSGGVKVNVVAPGGMGSTDG